MKNRLSKSDAVAFVILTWNSEEVITACLTSIAAFCRLRPYVVVVDNGSKDGTRDAVERFRRQHPSLDLALVALPENRGTTAPRNIGIRKAEGKAAFLCILDSDTVVNEEAFLTMLDALKKDSNIGIIGPRLYGKGGTLQNSGRAIPTAWIKLLKMLPVRSWRRRGAVRENIEKNPQGLTKVGYLMSACWLMRMELVQYIGGLDEGIFYAPEDVEYCLRAWSKGYLVVYDSRVSIRHDWQRLSRKKLFSKHNYEHIKGLFRLFFRYRYFFRAARWNRRIEETKLL